MGRGYPLQQFRHATQPAAEISPSIPAAAAGRKEAKPKGISVKDSRCRSS
jgi:hypothetical protein